METITTNSFTSEGYAVLKQLLCLAEIAAIKKEVEQILDQKRPSACVRPNNAITPLRWDERLISIFLRDRDRIVRLKATTNGDSLKWISAYISSKDPGTGPLWWHQDWWCWDHPQSFKKTASQVVLLCYLQPTSKDIGALRIIPGSHHSYTALHDKLPEAHADGHDPDSDHPAMADHEDQFTLDLDAGDAVVIDYRLLHGTHANKSTNRRDCIMLTFTPNWELLPLDIRGHLSRNFALPQPGEQIEEPDYDAELLPESDPLAIDIAVNRIPPPHFNMRDC